MSTSSPADIPVNHLAPQENEKEKTIRATCGLISETALAEYDLATRSWRMFAAISLWGSPESLETLPKSGMTRSGKLYPRPRLEPPTAATGLSVWPTPTTQEIEHPNAKWKLQGRKFQRVNDKGEAVHSMGLADAVQKWPTPQANDAKNPYARIREFSQAIMLGEAVVMNDPSTSGGKLNQIGRASCRERV